MKASILTAVLCGMCTASHILVFYPGASGSLLLSFYPLFQELSRRGHELTVVTKHPLPEVQNYNITQILIKRDNRPEVYETMKGMSFIPKIIYGLEYIIGDCENLYEKEEIKEIVNSDTGYDLFIGSPYYYLECSVAVAYHLKLPILNIYSNRFSIHASYSSGHPNPAAYISELHLGFGDNMSLWQRTINAVFHTWYSVCLSVYYMPRMAAVVQRHFPHLPPLQDLLSNIPVTLMNTNLAIHHAQPILPGVIPVGGLTISQQTELPKDLKEWMDSNEEGVILFSLGSNIKMTSLEPEVLQVILTVFKTLPQNILMKWESGQPDGMPGNVRTQNWIPQAAVLAHPQCRLFMTHGGLHSWEEAVYYGVPLLGLLPSFFDQTHNLEDIQDRGQGIHFTGPWTQDSLHSAISEVLNNPKYKENLQKASKVFVDQPMRPLDSAVYWTEYVIRHRGAAHLQSAVSTMPWYQSACVDILLVLAFTTSLLLWSLWTMLHWLKRWSINHKYTMFNNVLRVCRKLKLN